MKAMFVGLGSIGQRHLRNLKNLRENQKLEIIAYRQSSHQLVIEEGKTIEVESLANYYGVIEFVDLESALNEEPDIAFICNPSSMHIPTSVLCASKGCHLFIEKPVSTANDGLEELEQILKKNNLVSMIGFQTRFHPLIIEIIGLLKAQKYGQVISAQFNWSNYLPYFHPYEDYRKGYAARNDQGGGVTFSFSHELDLIQHFFGVPQSVYALGGHLSNLEIDVDDTNAALFQCGTGKRFFPVQLHLSFAQGEEQREFTILLEEGVLHCDLVKQKLQIVNHKREAVLLKHLPDLPRNDLFIAETKHLLDCLQNREQTQISLTEGKVSLLMSLAIHRSLKTQSPERIVV